MVSAGTGLLPLPSAPDGREMLREDPHEWQNSAFATSFVPHSGQSVGCPTCWPQIWQCRAPATSGVSQLAQRLCGNSGAFTFGSGLASALFPRDDFRMGGDLKLPGPFRNRSPQEKQAETLSGLVAEHLVQLLITPPTVGFTKTIAHHRPGEHWSPATRPKQFQPGTSLISADRVVEPLSGEREEEAGEQEGQPVIYMELRGARTRASQPAKCLQESPLNIQLGNRSRGWRCGSLGRSK